jgi:DNA-binding CsgD family transcriptional regulator
MGEAKRRGRGSATRRQDEIVRLYRDDGHTMAEIARGLGISTQRIQQILKRVENQTGMKLERAGAGRVEWQCGDCGEKRMVIRSRTDKIRCWNCAMAELAERQRNLPLLYSDEWYEWIIQARYRGMLWKDILHSLGTPCSYQTVQRHLWRYLCRRHKAAQARGIWEAVAVTATPSFGWLERKAPPRPDELGSPMGLRPLLAEALASPAMPRLAAVGSNPLSW